MGRFEGIDETVGDEEGTEVGILEGDTEGARVGC